MKNTERIITDFNRDDIGDFFDAFILDRKIRGLSPGSIRFYNQKLTPFEQWCKNQGLESITQQNSLFALFPFMAPRKEQ